MKFTFGDVKIFDADGKLTKIVTATALSKKMWENVMKEGSLHQKSSPEDRKAPVDPNTLNDYE